MAGNFLDMFLFQLLSVSDHVHLILANANASHEFPVLNLSSGIESTESKLIEIFVRTRPVEIASYFVYHFCYLPGLLKTLWEFILVSTGFCSEILGTTVLIEKIVN